MKFVKPSCLAKCLFLLFITTALSGCGVFWNFQPSVGVTNIKPEDYIAQQRGDVLATGRLSQLSMQTIRISGLDDGVCLVPESLSCLTALADFKDITEERRLSALSELWLLHAMRMPADSNNFTAWLESARYAYAYLFFTPRSPSDRAFEDRQTLVRDWYNYAVQQAITQLFDVDIKKPDIGIQTRPYALSFNGWLLNIDMLVRLPQKASIPDELIPANALGFQGLRSIYRRDGFGAEFVAVTKNDIQLDDNGKAICQKQKKTSTACSAPTWSEMPAPDITVVIIFAGENLDQVLSQQEATIKVLDPLVEDSFSINDIKVPLAGNFTAGYGLWLAHSGFGRQSLRSLFGREQGIQEPHLFMMQPYDPDRRIILMLHGLASSPEAWVNVANEILGDDELRKKFQIWQIYYPTNMPVAINHALIRKLLQDTLDNFDPNGKNKASQDMVLIGHSMGGMIGRLMVSSADNQLWEWLQSERNLSPERLDHLRAQINPVLQFEPVTAINRAIFIASPHKGTKVAGKGLVRWLASFVRLPLKVLRSIDDALVPSSLASGKAESARRLAIPTSLDNLDENDPFVIAAADLPISDKVAYHSIIARESANGSLWESNDGVVPYSSSHLAGAESEKIILADHSVQETAASILEIRRILHKDLDASGTVDLTLTID